VKLSDDVEQVVSVTTAINVHEPGTSVVSAHFSTRKGYEIVRRGGIIRISRGSATTCVPLSNVVDFEPAP
jgi:hypothetical protein